MWWLLSAFYPKMVTSHRYGPGFDSDSGPHVDGFHPSQPMPGGFPLGVSSTLRRAQNCSIWNRLIKPTGLARTCSGWHKIYLYPKMLGGGRDLRVHSCYSMTDIEWWVHWELMRTLKTYLIYSKEFELFTLTGGICVVERGWGDTKQLAIFYIHPGPKATSNLWPVNTKKDASWTIVLNVLVKRLTFNSISYCRDFVQKLSMSLLANIGSPLSHIDMSNNNIEDRGNATIAWLIL